jgi:hypothetical protein
VSINTGVSKEIAGSITPWISICESWARTNYGSVIRHNVVEVWVILGVPVIDKDEHSIYSQAELSLWLYT